VRECDWSINFYSFLINGLGSNRSSPIIQNNYKFLNQLSCLSFDVSRSKTLKKKKHIDQTSDELTKFDIYKNQRLKYLDFTAPEIMPSSELQRSPAVTKLVSSPKLRRDKSLRILLKSWQSKNLLPQNDAKKLWKSLFYSVYHSDKPHLTLQVHLVHL
jgi:hypothetical protein